MVPRETPRAAECSKEIFEAIAPREGVPGIASSARSARSRRADAPGSVSVRRPSRAGLRSRASVRGMPLVEFACDGQLLFTVEASKRLGMLPRIGEALVVEEARYVVVDVEYGARRAGDPQRRDERTPSESPVDDSAEDEGEDQEGESEDTQLFGRRLEIDIYHQSSSKLSR